MAVSAAYSHPKGCVWDDQSAAGDVPGKLLPVGGSTGAARPSWGCAWTVTWPVSALWTSCPPASAWCTACSGLSCGAFSGARSLRCWRCTRRSEYPCTDLFCGTGMHTSTSTAASEWRARCSTFRVNCSVLIQGPGFAFRPRCCAAWKLRSWFPWWEWQQGLAHMSSATLMPACYSVCSGR